MSILNRLAEWARIPYVTQGDPIREALEAMVRFRNRQAIDLINRRIVDVRECAVTPLRVSTKMIAADLIVDWLLDIRNILVAPQPDQQPTPDPTPGAAPAPPITLPNTESVTCIVCGQVLPVGGIHDCGLGEDYRPEKVA